MQSIEIRLFGQLRISLADGRLLEIENGKGQKLFCYLLLHSERPHAREALATLLWGDSTAGQARKYLRQALWQLNQAFHEVGVGTAVVADSTWVSLSDDIAWRVDVAEFSRLYVAVRDIPGRAFSPECLAGARRAVELYRTELLAQWYDDWCLFERERLLQMYIAIVEKLLAYCLADRAYEEGRFFADLILRRDRAHERTHRRLMRLHAQAGNRTAALRQYEHCVAALDDELGVKPSQRTMSLYHQICRGDAHNTPLPANGSALPDVLSELRGHLSRLDRMQQQLNYDILRLESALTGRAVEA